MISYEFCRRFLTKTPVCFYPECPVVHRLTTEFITSDTIAVMDTKSKILFGVFGILILLSVSASYYRFMVLHDYLVQTEVDCDPTFESCFVWECGAESEECTGNPDEDTWYYKIAYRNAKNIPACDAEDQKCDQFTCPEGGEAECREVLCSEATLEEYHIDRACTLPEDFAEEALMDETDEDQLSEELPNDKANEDTAGEEEMVIE